MKMRWFFGLALAFVFSLAAVSAALAGGWATITLDEWPQGLVAEQPQQFGLTVRQHGQDDRKVNGLDVSLTFKNIATLRQFSVKATGDGRDGHYTAEVTLPEAGEWTWSIQAFGMNQPMPPLTVQPGGQAATSSVTGIGSQASAAVVMLGLLAALALAGRRRYRWALAVAVVGLALGGVGLASAAGRAPADAPISPTLAPSSQELGEALFVGKGCVSCHLNSQIDPVWVTFSTEMGPNLSSYKTSAEYLRLWLSDPRAVKPQTQMPNLELDEAEMEALIAFILEGQAE